MCENYRKYLVKAQLVNDRYKMDPAVESKISCAVETYKEKRAIHFAAGNLVPSAELWNKAGIEYRLLLLGQSDEGIIHKDFGSFFVNKNGDGICFKKFEGTSILSYSHCLLVATGEEGIQAEKVAWGQMPFYDPWKEVFAKIDQKLAQRIFNEKIDDIKGVWHKIVASEGTYEITVPGPIEFCSLQIQRYENFIVGRNQQGDNFVGIPGRFLSEEQPEGEAGRLTLWQPVCGGEKFFSDYDQLQGELALEIYGYWIGKIDKETGRVQPC